MFQHSFQLGWVKSGCAPQNLHCFPDNCSLFTWHVAIIAAQYKCCGIPSQLSVNRLTKIVTCKRSYWPMLWWLGTVADHFKVMLRTWKVQNRSDNCNLGIFAGRIFMTRDSNQATRRSLLGGMDDWAQDYAGIPIRWRNGWKLKHTNN